MKMASMQKRAWKLQDFMAHNANVNCVALGHKSGRVMVTGGDDRKVNLWAIGKQSCFMSLSGHTTPIECVQFNQFEEFVCAGSRAGALKVWDLEAAKLVRTLNGHKNAIKCMDFHPVGEYLASGSADTTIKMWDSRKKGCIFTYNGHKATVNSLKFSPDGHWIASGSDDATVKIWDLRVGRVLKEFGDHLNAVMCVEFHPHEFLLSSGSADRSVQLYDLENFNVVSNERELGSAVKCMCFNPDGECLFVGVSDALKVVGWEPSRLFDSVPVPWHRISDISIAHNQLVGASYHLTNVQVHVVDLKRVQPLGGSSCSPTSSTPQSPFSYGQSIRKSFSKAQSPITLKNKTPDVKTIEESTSGTDPEEDSTAEVVNYKDYSEIFKGRGLVRTPPPLEPESFQQPEHDYSDPAQPQILGDSHHQSDNFEALSLDNNINRINSPPAVLSTKYSRSKSNLDQVYVSRLVKEQNRENILPNINKNKSTVPQIPTPRFNLQRQNSCKEETTTATTTTKPNSIIKHSASEVNINKTSKLNNATRKNSFSKPSRNSSVPNVSKLQPPNFKAPLKPSPSSTTYINAPSGVPVDLYVSTPKVLQDNTFKKPLPHQRYINSPPPVDIYVNSKVTPDSSPMEEDEFIPNLSNRPAGLDVDDFLPKNYRTSGFQQQLPDMSEAEVLGAVMRGHEPLMHLLRNRQRNFKIVIAEHRSKGIKGAVESAIAMDDPAVLVDLLAVFNNKSTLWNLDMCVLVLPKIQELLQSKFESYLTTACSSLKLILRHFGHVIKSNVQSPAGSFGVDISKEERYRKSVKCHEILVGIRSYLTKKQTMPGSLGSAFKEINALMQNTFD